MPRGTGTPKSRSTAFAWYSWMFMRNALVERVAGAAARGRRRAKRFREVGRDLLAGVDQPAHRVGRLLEHRPLGAVELDLDDALDALRAEHDRHADIEILHAVLAVEIGGAGQHALLVA